MTDLTKRDYLKLAGTGVGGIALLSGGFIVTNDRNPASSNGGSELSPPRVEPPPRDETDVGPGDTVGDTGGGARSGAESDSSGSGQNDPGNGDNRLDYERDGDGDIEFDYRHVSFESDNGDIDLQDDGVDLETEDRSSIDLLVDHGDAHVDLEMDDRGRSVELRITAGSDHIDFEVDGHDDVEFEAARGPRGNFEDDDGEIEYATDSIDFEWDDDAHELDITGVVDLEMDLDGGVDFEYNDGTVLIDYDTEELEYRGHTVDLEWDHRTGDDDFEARKP